MKRKSLAQDVADKTKLDVSIVDAVLVEAHKAMVKSLAKGEAITLRGFGTYSLKARKSKSVWNFKNKKGMYYPARNVVSFKPAPDLKEAVAKIPVAA